MASAFFSPAGGLDKAPAPSPKLGIDPEPDDERYAALSRWTQRFVSPSLELAYSGRHAADFCRPTASAAHTLCQVIFFGAVTAVGFTMREYSAAARASAIFSATAIVAVLGALGVRAAQIVTAPRAVAVLHELLAVCLCALFTAYTLVRTFVFGDDDSSSTGERPTGKEASGYASLDSVLLLPTASILVSVTCYVLLGAQAWPRSALASVSGLVAFLGSLVVAAGYLGGDQHWYVCVAYACYMAFFVMLVMLVSWERRRDFVASLVLEKGRQQAAVERAATDALVQALFPADIARELVQARIEQTRRTVTMPSMAVTTTKSSFHTADMPPQSRPTLVAKSIPMSTVVAVALHGLDKIEETGEQLDTLAKVLLALEGSSKQLLVDKISMDGPIVLFSCGHFQEGERSNKIACEFAVALQRLMMCLRLDLGNDSINFAVGIATGPAVEVTVSVAKRLAQTARPGQALATRDVAKNLRKTFDFRLIKDLTQVRGIGTILLFQLSYPFAERPSLSACRRKQIHLSEVAKSDVVVMREHLNPYLLSFADFKKERSFLRFYAENYFLHLRWCSFIVAVGQTAFAAMMIASGNFHPIAIGVILPVLLWVIFGCMWLPIQKRPVLYYAVVWTACLAATAILSVITIGKWYSDRMMLLIVVFEAMLFMSNMPFYMVGPLSIFVALSTLPLFIHGKFGVESAVCALGVIVTWYLAHRDTESRIRNYFSSSGAVEQSKQENEREKALGDELVMSAVPRPFLDRLIENDVGYIAETIPSCTAMVCEVCDFELRLQRMPPLEVVSLLNQLYSHFDLMAAQHHIWPLKTKGSKYVIVGNIMNDMDDHVEHVTDFAKQILREMPRWNEENMAEWPVNVRIGIHTDSEVAGVIKTNTIIFDCWGTAIPIAERICDEAPPGTALVSSSTLQFYLCKTEKYVPVTLNGLTFDTYLLDMLGGFNVDTNASGRYPFEPMAGDGGIDYGMVPAHALSDLQNGEFELYDPAFERAATPSRTPVYVDTPAFMAGRTVAFELTPIRIPVSGYSAQPSTSELI
eukprot:m51a1_g2982 putative adenylate cyclase (1038) ;mRNA; r:721987-725818